MKITNALALPWPVLLVLAVLVMLGLQAALEYRLLAPIATNMARLSDEVRTERARHASTGQRVDSSTLQSAATLDLQERLSGILGHLQGAEATAARIERLHRIADQSGVIVRKASYQDQMASGDIGRHEIQADLGGAYPAIRQFLRELSVQDQALAIESLEFSRQAGGAGVRVQVRMALYFRRATP